METCYISENNTCRKRPQKQGQIGGVSPRRGLIKMIDDDCGADYLAMPRNPPPKPGLGLTAL
jgi:hypothetical protein